MELVQTIGTQNWDKSKKIKTGLLCLGIIVLSCVLIATAVLSCGGSMAGLCFSVGMLAKIGLATKITTSLLSAVVPFIGFFGADRYRKRTVYYQMKALSRNSDEPVPRSPRLDRVVIPA